MQHAFASRIFGAMVRELSFDNCILEQDQTFAYECATKLLKAVGWFHGEDLDKTCVIQSPEHVQDLDALLRVFPRAKLIFSHRDRFSIPYETHNPHTIAGNQPQ